MFGNDFMVYKVKLDNRKSNVTINLYSISSTDNSTGIQISKGNWNGLVGMAVRGEIDVIVSELKMTVERLDYLDFTYPLIRSK